METRIVAKVVVVNVDDQLLVVRRSAEDTRRPLQWDIPGGHVEAHELPSHAAARETQEEAGIMIDTQQLQLIYSVSAVPTGEFNMVWLFYVTHTTQSAVTLSHEHTEYRWVSLKEAIDLIEYDRQRTMLEYLEQNGLLSS